MSASSQPHRPTPLYLSPDSHSTPSTSLPSTPSPSLPSTFLSKAKRRFSETLQHAPSVSIPSGLKHLGSEVEKKLPKFLQGDHTEHEHVAETEKRAWSVAPTTHRENTALHALLDSLPTLPTLTTPSLPSFPSLNPFSASAKACFVADYSDDEDPTPPIAVEKEKEVKNDPLKKLEGNTIVAGGYRGSILRDAKTNKRLWIPLRVGFGFRKPDLGLGLEDIDEERSTETVIPGRMLMAVGGVIDLGKRLKDKLKYLESLPPNITPGAPTPLKFHNWGYDWRRRLELSSTEMLKFLERLKEESAARGEGLNGVGEGATVIAHSMGGLVALHALAKAADPTVFKKILFAGTPFGGCVNVLGPLKRGDGVLFNKEICSPAVVFSMRSSFYFLPDSGACFETPSGHPLPVDFFNPQSWSDYNLSPVTGALFEPAGEKRERMRREGRERAESASEMGVGGVLEMGALGNGVEGEGEKVEEDDEKERKRMSGEIATPVLETSTSTSTEPTEPTLHEGQPLELEDTPMTSPPSSPREGGSGTATPTLNPNSVSQASDQLIADYLVRTLQRVRQFHREIVDLYDEEKAEKGLYPRMAIITSQKTPTVRGVMTDSLEAIRDGFYEHLLYGPGDGIVLYESAKSLPGGENKWNKHLKGVVESSHGHVSLLGDLESVRKALELLQD